MNKKFGFTLAEVLITLGIIGVVAAMTIPTLIANTNSAKFRSQFKKTLSTMNQAGLMGIAQYDIDYAATTDACTAATEEGGKAGASDNPDSNLTFCAILNGTLAGASNEGAGTDLKNTKGDYTWVKTYTLKGNSSGEGSGVENKAVKELGYIIYSLADGAIVGFPASAKSCTLTVGTPLTGADQLATGKPLNGCIGFIDVNGATLPNKEVNCTTDTETALEPEKPCVVKNDAVHMTDIYPIVFHDATVEPASNAAKYVLTTSK